MRKYAGVILDTAGNVSEGASITVYLTGTTTKATLYLDEGVTQITNPVTSDTNGRFSFYVADGEYNFKVSGSNITTYTISDIQIVDAYAHISATDPHTQYQKESELLDYSLTVALADLKTRGPWVDVRAYDTLVSANTAAYNAGLTLLITKECILAANTILTAAVKVIKGGSFKKVSTFTLTINGPFEAGFYQVFSGFNAGDVTFGSGSVKEIYPQWWGAKGDNSTDSTIAIQCGINATYLGKKLSIPNGNYLFTTLSIVKSIYIEGEGSVIRWGDWGGETSIYGSATRLIKTGAGDGITVSNSSDLSLGGIYLKNIELTPQNVGGGGDGLVLNNSGTGTINGIFLENVDVRYWGGRGIYSTGTVFDVTSTHCSVRENVGDGIEVVAGGGTPSQWAFIDCFLASNTGVWALKIPASLVRIVGGTVAGVGTGHGVWILGGSITGTNIEGANGAGSIGVKYTGVSSLFLDALVFFWATGVRNEGRGLTIVGDLSQNTVDLHQTSGLSLRYTVFLNNAYSDGEEPTILNDRETTDGAYGELVFLRNHVRFTGTMTWDPASVANGSYVWTDITVLGATVGDPCVASFSSIGGEAVLVSAQVASTNIVRVFLYNIGGANLDLPSGNLNVIVWKYL